MASSIPYHYSASIDDDEQSASEITQLLIKCFHPASVVDFGCGLGNFVAAFKNGGVEALGIDGEWAKNSPLFKLKTEDAFRIADLEKPVLLHKKYDLALCLEVAEHLSAEAAAVLVENLTNASDLIVFSAAVPGQGGIHHINEQWPDYWKEKFLARDFIFYDVLRPVVWNNVNISWWYRQNVYVFAHRSVKIDDASFRSAQTSDPVNYLHPGILQTRNAELQKIFEGREGIRFYLRLLGKALRHKFKF